MRFSANLGFLWADRPLPEAIRAAGAAGFDAVECHWPYDVPADEVRAVLEETGIPMLGLNTRPGGPGENGLAALPSRGAEARAAVDEAVAYAAAVGARHVHVMAGVADGPDARDAFLGVLDYACGQAERHGLSIVIEPLNRYDAPGYFLTTTTEAREVIETLGARNLALMFDCYHVQLMEGDLTHRLAALLPLIGHVQIAAVPDRGPPDHGELDYGHVLGVLGEIGYRGAIGAEYRPGGPTEASLGWLRTARAMEREGG